MKRKRPVPTAPAEIKPTKSKKRPLSSFSKSVGEGLRKAAIAARCTAQIYGTPLCVVKNGKVVLENPYTGAIEKSKSTKTRLQPPAGFNSWLVEDYERVTSPEPGMWGGHETLDKFVKAVSGGADTEPLTPDELSELTQIMVAASSETEAKKYQDVIVAGWYGRTLGKFMCSPEASRQQAITLKNPLNNKLWLISVCQLASGPHLCIPAQMAAQLQLEQRGSREVVMSDGQAMSVPYVGPIEIDFGGNIGFCGAVVFGDEVAVGSIPQTAVRATAPM